MSETYGYSGLSEEAALKLLDTASYEDIKYINDKAASVSGPTASFILRRGYEGGDRRSDYITDFVAGACHAGARAFQYDLIVNRFNLALFHDKAFRSDPKTIESARLWWKGIIDMNFFSPLMKMSKIIYDPDGNLAGIAFVPCRGSFSLLMAFLIMSRHPNEKPAGHLAFHTKKLLDLGIPFSQIAACSNSIEIGSEENVRITDHAYSAHVVGKGIYSEVFYDEIASRNAIGANNVPLYGETILSNSICLNSRVVGDSFSNLSNDSSGTYSFFTYTSNAERYQYSSKGFSEKFIDVYFKYIDLSFTMKKNKEKNVNKMIEEQITSIIKERNKA